jgi:hypothetical protein
MRSKILANKNKKLRPCFTESKQEKVKGQSAKGKTQK